MSTRLDVTVPDIGDFDEVDVIEILVAIGATVALDDPLVTLESEKATMDIPAPAAGQIAEIKVAVGDKVSQGSVIVVITSDAGVAAASTPPQSAAIVQPASAAPARASASPDIQPAETVHATGFRASDEASIEVTVPDIGDFEDVEVIEILVQVGDIVAAEDPILTLESEKATMDIPAPAAGRIEAILVNLGERISEGHRIARIAAAPSAVSGGPRQTTTERAPRRAAQSADASVTVDAAPPPQGDTVKSNAAVAPAARAYASPSVRKFARELGVDLTRISGSGRKHRITKPDVKAFVKSTLDGAAVRADAGFALPRAQAVDFSKFGEIETHELSKVRQLTGQNLHRSWVTAPHVTQFDEADITELETFRKAKLSEAEAGGVKLTMLAFLIKAAVVALKQHPDFNASLSADGASIIHKKYFNIGIAVNTERGLVVPVLRDAEKKGLLQIAAELRDLSIKAREKKLTPLDMQGACFTISSLGGVGGTFFTPIINVPEVAILGVSPAAIKPVFVDNEFVPRLILPFALSYDHRVIDGVAGAAFTRFLGTVLGDIRNILL